MNFSISKGALATAFVAACGIGIGVLSNTMFGLPPSMAAGITCAVTCSAMAYVINHIHGKFNVKIDIKNYNNTPPRQP